MHRTILFHVCFFGRWYRVDSERAMVLINAGFTRRALLITVMYE